MVTDGQRRLMMNKKRYTAVIAGVALVALAAYARTYGHKHKRCDNEQSCKKDSHCQCYCSELGDYRDKVNEDEPVYLPKGKKKMTKNGEQIVHCFCKQWDIDKFPGPVTRDTK